jgi:hypothetical protein
MFHLFHKTSVAEPKPHQFGKERSKAVKMVLKLKMSCFGCVIKCESLSSYGVPSAGPINPPGSSIPRAANSNLDPIIRYSLIQEHIQAISLLFFY